MYANNVLSFKCMYMLKVNYVTERTSYNVLASYTMFVLCYLLIKNMLSCLCKPWKGVCNGIQQQPAWARKGNGLITETSYIKQVHELV